MQDFNFHSPSSVADAVSLLSNAEEPKLLAGGQSLLPLMKLDLAQPSDVVSLAGVSELRGIRAEGGAVVIGAAEHLEVHERIAIVVEHQTADSSSWAHVIQVGGRQLLRHTA